MKSLTVVALAAFAFAGSAQAALPGAVTFDGYCDGMDFVNLGGGFQGGVSTGCITDPIHGVSARVKGGQGLSYVVTAYGSSGGLTFIVREDGTWYIETADGTGTFINSGTWTAALAPLGPRPGKAAGSR